MATTRVGVRTATRTALAVYAASLSLPALSLGLGDIEMQSFLNEPLRAQVALLDVRELNAEDIRIRLAQIEDFERLGVDRSYFLTSIEFDVSLDPSTGRGVIRLSTPDAVLEPYLDLIIEARWPQGRVLREYTVLVDPPAFRQEVISVSASERVGDARPDKPAVARDEIAGSSIPDVVDAANNGAARGSTLPSGEMPERAFSAETAVRPRAGSRYMVKRDETLWQIASQGRPEDVTVQQAMLDIQRLNPEAFIDGNINRIKAGYIIYLPSAGEVSSDDLAAALEKVRAQNRAFSEGEPVPGVSATATLRVSADTTPVESAREGAVNQEPAAPSAASDTAVERIAGRQGPEMVPETGPQIQDPEMPADETAAGADPQLAAQLAAMSERLDTLEQIVSLKDEQIATLERALREAREAAATPPPKTQAPAAPTVTTPAPTTPAPTASAPAPVRAPDVAPSLPWLPIGGGVLAALLALALFLRRRAAQETPPDELNTPVPPADDEPDVFKGVSLNSEALADTSEAPEAAIPIVEPSRETEAAEVVSRGGSRGYGERKNDDYIDDGAAGDALAEADIYIAYGRYLQAIELLDTAIASEPDNSAYRVKLIELYVDMGEEANAAEQLQALREHGDADAIARAETLLGGPAVPAPAGPPPSDPEPTAPVPDPNSVFAEPPALEAESPSGEVAQEYATASSADDLDLDLDLGEPDIHVDLEDEAEPQAAFDSDPVPSEEDNAPVVKAVSDAVDTSEPLVFDQLEIEEDDSHTGPAEDTLDLDEAGEPDEILDLTDALNDFATSRMDEPAGDEQEHEDLLIADDADQMATKLDLARAYLDMGDSEGARGILEEVASAGTGDQQQEARDLLERIA